MFARGRGPSLRGMSKDERVQIFVEEGLRASALSGAHNFLRLLQETLIAAGYEVAFVPIDARHGARGKTITHMKPPATRNGLVFRRVYHYPFWQIEQTDKRWHWDVAQAIFDPAALPGQEARRFQAFWRKRLFPGLEPHTGDAIYIPLQGKIGTHRRFQTCRPLDMVAQVMVATDRPVVIGLHPKETYSETDRAQLQKIARGATIQMGGMEKVLPACHAIATMNSAVAFNGTFFNKPVHLFADIDFHHIAQKKAPDQLADALETPEPKPYAKYLHWFWQDQSINAGRPGAPDKIRSRLARFGWL